MLQAQAVVRGECVLVFDAHDEAEAKRASKLLDHLGGRDNDVVPRATSHIA